jgi:hypothetical protein
VSERGDEAVSEIVREEREKAAMVLRALESTDMSVADLTEALPFLCAAMFLCYGDEAEELMETFFRATRTCFALLKEEAKARGLEC